jgi:hypothetical protein
MVELRWFVFEHSMLQLDVSLQSVFAAIESVAACKVAGQLV